ncbi:hypothetical protein G6F33_011443 [Rhizopus arrhizus]|nr:hypothetical protein G6F24_011722 [Rhizopus arrhizus]KAG0906361.1 hypothetical protein G6F33_011443 [Rhizopus arrhizus]
MDHRLISPKAVSEFHEVPLIKLFAFLKFVTHYETLIWHILQQYITPATLGLLRNLFDDVLIEVLLSNTSSRRLHPRTGVLQGSILSPYLYSVYINQLPALLRPQTFTADKTPDETIPLLNCLLYADDVALISDQQNMVHLLEISH